MDDNLFWSTRESVCPFDSTDMGRYKKVFRSNKGDLSLPIWICPLCERMFVRYKKHGDLIKKYPNVQCRFLDFESPQLESRKRREEEQRKRQGIFEPTADLLIKYKALFQHYELADETSFCECFSENREVYRFFSNRYGTPNSNNRSFRDAIDDAGINKTVRFRIKQYCKKEEELARAKNVQAFFREHYRDEDGSPYLLDDEQSLAVAVSEPRILASARAGSGKTRTIVAKIVYLMDHDNVVPSQILSLAFNNNVPVEINQRVNDLLKSRWPDRKDEISLARTFHGLAYEIVSPRRVISGAERTRFIQELITEQKETDPSFKASVYETFRKEDSQLYKKHFQNEQAFYDSLRNTQYTTLNGEIVKSRGEKWIADYLFEHGIRYNYEPAYYPRYITNEDLALAPEDVAVCSAFLDGQSKIYPSGKRVRRTVKPDFLLTDYACVWEHWGIDELNQNRFQNKTEDFELSWEAYHDLMQWKRHFWNGSWRRALRTRDNLLHFGRKTELYIKRIKDVSRLVETSVADMDNGREAFEEKLDNLMETLGIPHAPRSRDELEEEVWSKQIKRFTSMIESFVDKYEQRYPSGNDSEFKKKWKSTDVSGRTNDFLALGLTILERYRTVLSSKKKPVRFAKYGDYSHDFNQLIAEAAQLIEQGKADYLIRGYRFLFIDEYQDFSELFYSFISSILSRKPEIELFCVGDTWQAINRFMGADTEYFERFDSFFPGSRKLLIRTNYRSTKRIVTLSNRFMNACGFDESPAVSSREELGPQCFHIDVNDIYVALQDDSNDGEVTQLSRVLSGDNQSMVQTQYLKKITDIARDNKGGEILILTRTNVILRVDLDRVQKSIHDYLVHQLAFSEDEAKRVKVMTMHRAKGLQADIVIILEVNQKSIPKIHPDNELYEVFGETQEKIYEDEERLFYVAITRAKKQFWVLYDGKPSVFVDYLSGRR